MSPIVEIVMNGTNAAADAGTISHDEARKLNQEHMLAADLEVERAISDCMAESMKYEG